MHFKTICLSIALTSFIFLSACGDDSVSADSGEISDVAEKVSSSSVKKDNVKSSSSQKSTKVSSSSEAKSSEKSSSSVKRDDAKSSSSQKDMPKSSSSSQKKADEVSSSSETMLTCEEGSSKDSTYAGMNFKYKCTDGQWQPDQLYFSKVADCRKDGSGATKDTVMNGVMSHLICTGGVWQAQKSIDLSCTEEGATKYDLVGNLMMDMVCKKNERSGKLVWTPDNQSLSTRFACSEDELGETKDTIISSYIITYECKSSTSIPYKWTSLKSENMASCPAEKEGAVVTANILGNEGAYLCTQGYWIIEDLEKIIKCNEEGAIDTYIATNRTVFPMVCKEGRWTLDRSRTDYPE